MACAGSEDGRHEGDGAGRTVAVVGISTSPTCGVRAHAELLTGGLQRAGIGCSWHWLNRHEPSLRGSRAEIGAWTGELAGELGGPPAEAILLHYSVFSYSFRGVPIFVHPVLSALRSRGIPIVSVLHEFAYPWLYGGWRGLLWATTQRAAAIEVMRASAAAIVTAPERQQWLRTRPWLARRPVALAPVYSNLPAPTGSRAPVGARPRVGLFGYSYQGAAVALVLDALAALRAQGSDAELVLLGAPGASSAAGATWTGAAAERGLERAVTFTGALPAQELSDALARCEVLLFADTAGASSRKGTLAGSLASGRPVVALDGPRTWRKLREEGAARIVAPTLQALAGAVGSLLADEAERERLGQRGRRFAEQRMGLEVTVRAVKELLEQVRAPGAPAAA